MPKKNKKPAPFMTFVKEYQRKNRKLKLEQAISYCGSIWQKMSQQEKDVYKNKSKYVTLDLSNTERCSSQGIPLSVLEKEKEEREKKEAEMMKEITDTVTRTRNVGILSDQKYYIIMGNYFYHKANGDIYFPAEIGICEYSLKNGVMRKYHSLLNPKNDIFGYTYVAQTHSQSTHGLPLPPNDALGETDLGMVYLRLCEFLSKSGYSKTPPVYTNNNDIRIIESMLKYMKDQCDVDAGTIRVFPLQQLFYELKKVTAEIGNTKKPNSIHITNAIFDQDYYEHQSDIACEFHERIDKSKYCAMSYAIRWAYTFSDNMCADLNIDMKPGYHVPIDIDMTLVALSLNDSNKSENTEELSTFNSKNPFNCTTTSCDSPYEEASSNEEDESYNPWTARSKLHIPPADDDDFSYSGCSIGSYSGCSIDRGSDIVQHPLQVNQTHSFFSDNSAPYFECASTSEIKLPKPSVDDDDFVFNGGSVGRGNILRDSIRANQTNSTSRNDSTSNYQCLSADKNKLYDIPPADDDDDNDFSYSGCSFGRGSDILINSLRNQTQSSFNNDSNFNSFSNNSTLSRRSFGRGKLFY